MAQFSSFNNRLPDPVSAYSEAGHTTGSVYGPGFASVTFQSNQPVAMSRTNSGRVVTRSIAGHNWKIQIKYNPMTRAQFEPVYAFLQEKRGRLKPFEVVLPQYNSPQTAITCASGTQLTLPADIAAGATNFLANNHSSASSGALKQGDMFTFNDTSNSNHKKVYQITRVMDAAEWLGVQPGNAERRYYVTPSIEKSVESTTTTLVTTNPTFRVIQTSDVVSYNLNTNNLYEFSLNLEEAQP